MLKDLIEEIQKIGKKKMKDLEASHKEAVTELKKKYTEKKKESVEIIEDKAKTAIETVKSRTEMLANTERRKQTLAVKRGIIDSVFVDTLENLRQSDKYAKYLEIMVAKAQKEVSEGEIIPAKGKKEATESAIKGTSYTLGSEGHFKGGFIVRAGKVEYDFTFDSLIEKQLRDELETKVAHILF